jgi:hypothetical protein
MTNLGEPSLTGVSSLMMQRQPNTVYPYGYPSVGHKSIENLSPLGSNNNAVNR